MKQQIEKEEKEYLKRVVGLVDVALGFINERIQSQSDEVYSLNRHMQEHKTDMDHLEKNAVREAISNTSLLGDHSVDKKKRLIRLRNVPYFGRIDFKKAENGAINPIYVGVHTFRDDDKNVNLVYDWRAPISSMFYDFEMGEAGYTVQDTTIQGEIVLKRQFRIRQGEMEYMLDSAVTIQDEVLQKELNQASTGKMRNIVATIQREQNAIIRNEEARHLIIQGVAGSGKTSIALHRIAFLLYKFKDTIVSTDILIISPNKVFSSYISNVLPELGEETVAETSMEEIASELFDYKVKFQTFFQQVAELVTKKDDALAERIRFKSSEHLLSHMDEYVLHLENTLFVPVDMLVARRPVPAWFVRDSFRRHSRRPLLTRFNEVVRDIVSEMMLHYQYEVKGKERTALHASIRKMCAASNLRLLYKGFYEWLERPGLLKLRAGSTYEYSDVYPLLYLKMKLEGLKSYSHVKHLVVDEMQDYSPVQYRIVNELFSCRKTILGDINQSVNPYSSSGVDNIRTVFPDATCMTMLKSYRSTLEITHFTKKIRPSVEVEAMERHGEEPQVIRCKNEKDEHKVIADMVRGFVATPSASLGIICKTQAQASKFHQELKEQQLEVLLLDASSMSFNGGIVVTAAHLAKGLEFDSVIVPMVSAKHYQSDPERQLLYVACTRAMHQLRLTYSGDISPFLT